MEIKVFGPGCARCKETEQLVKDVLAAKGVAASVTKVSDPKEMMAVGIMSTPAVVIDGVLKSTGKIPSKEEIAAWIDGGSASVPVPKGSGCCSGIAAKDAHCCTPAKHSEKRLLIEFLFIDLTVCKWCLGTDAILTEALAEVENLLKAAGYVIEVRKILVETEEQARELGFVSSPTIRVNGQDIQPDVKECLCESCSDISGGEVDCRVWVWQGQEYTTPPKAMIADAILRYVYGGQHASSVAPKEVPDNLKKFFAAKTGRCC